MNNTRRINFESNQEFDNNISQSQIDELDEPLSASFDNGRNRNQPELVTHTSGWNKKVGMDTTVN